MPQTHLIWAVPPSTFSSQIILVCVNLSVLTRTATKSLTKTYPINSAYLWNASNAHNVVAFSTVFVVFKSPGLNASDLSVCRPGFALYTPICTLTVTTSFPTFFTEASDLLISVSLITSCVLGTIINEFTNKQWRKANIGCLLALCFNMGHLI